MWHAASSFQTKSWDKNYIPPLNHLNFSSHYSIQTSSTCGASHFLKDKMLLCYENLMGAKTLRRKKTWLTFSLRKLSFVTLNFPLNSQTNFFAEWSHLQKVFLRLRGDCKSNFLAELCPSKKKIQKNIVFFL